MPNEHLLAEGLSRYGIPFPKRYRKSGKFMRWGERRGSTKYWAIPVGDGYIYGDFSTGLSSYIFPDKSLTKRENQKRRKAIEELRENLGKKMRQEEARAAKRAWEIWEYAKAAPHEHPYLKKKQIKPYSVRVDNRNRLIIPLLNIDNKISSIQYIYPNGCKQYLKEAEKRGMFFPIQSQVDNPTRIVLSEGYATGASIFESFDDGKLSVVCCMDAGNLSPVAKLFRAKCPNAELIICSDNDQYGAINAGLEKAIEAGASIRAYVVFPVFKDETMRPTDFNDLFVLDGAEAVRE
jgi:putative DNA primase/helicase